MSADDGKPTIRDGQAVEIACALIAAYPKRYAAATPHHSFPTERIGADVRTLLAALPDWPADEDDDKRVRPDWGDRPAGFRT